MTGLSALTEAHILELVSAGKIAELFPYKPASGQPIPADTVAEEELGQASALPLSRAQRDALIESSLPPVASKKERAFSKGWALGVLILALPYAPPALEFRREGHE